MLRSATALLVVLMLACGGSTPPAKAAPDYDAVRNRANQSHESLKDEEQKRQQ